MTTARDDAYEDLLAEFQDDASPAVYRPRAAGEAAGFPAGQGGAAVATYARIVERQRGNSGAGYGWYARIRVPAGQIPDPRPGDVLEIDGTAWELLPIKNDTSVEGGDVFWILACGTDTVPNWGRS